MSSAFYPFPCRGDFEITWTMVSPDARKMGTLVDRVHRELTDEDIAKIAETYHRWRGDGSGKDEDAAKVCASCKAVARIASR